MTLKKTLTLYLFSLSISLFAAEPALTTVKLYGFVSNEFFYNSRQNVELVDGTITLFPKPVSINSSGIDAAAVPQAEMLSVNSRLGIDINGTPILGAKSSGKIETDFAGTGATFFVLRIRQAYVKLNWDKTELLLGQTWHPLFGNIVPSTPSANAGAPFQPFNRSPQLRVKQTLTNTLSFTASALYEMQYASMGSLGTSNVYLKNSLLPNIFVGFENKTTHFISGVGGDFKTLKLLGGKITSLSGTAYIQYSNNLLTVKAKAIYGQNLTNQLMLGGYGVSNVMGNDTTYTNLNTATGWLNITYGSKIQVGILGGYCKNLGVDKNLYNVGDNTVDKFIIYGYGFTSKSQTLLNELFRIAPSVSYNLPNFKFALEYDITTATYGKIQNTGKINSPYNTDNKRIVASMSYIF